MPVQRPCVSLRGMPLEEWTGVEIRALDTLGFLNLKMAGCAWHDLQELGDRHRLTIIKWH